MKDEYNIEDIVCGLDFDANKYNDIGNGLMLTNKEMAVLDSYNIDYRKCCSLKEILFEIEAILNEMEILDEELDYVSSTISERDYYQNTNK